MESTYIDKVTDKIYLGCYNGALDVAYLKAEKINNILSLIGNDSPGYERGDFTQKVIDIDDFPKENIIQYFKECIEFIESANKTYVHCMCGISRSSTIVIAYLMWKTHATYNEAYFFVKNRRRYISPNEGFVQQLKIFEKLLKENDYDLNKIDFGKIKWPQ